ncbi:MAG: hypothetical protein UW24_C0021G0004 [Parcubacteria group bacterium GW2011_GWA2_44_12]|nr:MAG: hypothetical protein UW24_C0021G0004 [Parcubacteria group bacterium GW2011_GWA2_44_12]
MGLDNPKADKLLVKFAQDIFVDIKKSKDNESIFEALDLVNEFVYKAPKETIEIVSYIFGKKPIPPKAHKSPFGEFEGKAHKDLVLKGIELLDHIRYIVPNEVLKLVAQFSLDENSAIKGKALDVVKKFSRYDYNVLTKSKIGYGAQRKAMDFVLAWSREEQLKRIDFVETVLKEILNPSVEGTTSGLNKEDQVTITFHYGVVSPTNFLKKMRREAINLAYELYKAAEDPKLKLKLIGVFDEASRTPGNVLYGDDVVQMIVDDLRYIADIYRKIVFGETEDKMTDHLGIVATIEKRLYWINRSEKRKVEKSEKLRRDILKDELYHLFRLLVGDWDTAEKSRGEEIDQLISSINEVGLGGWFENLNKIAGQHTIIEEWKFNPFKGFIKKLSEKKPQISDEILGKAFDANSSIKHFTSSFLDGFRTGAHFMEWDKYAGMIINAKDQFLVTAMVSSLNLPQDSDLEKLVREQDIDLLENITKREGTFSFLKKETDDRILQYELFNTLARNFVRSHKRIEPLIVEEIKNYPKDLNRFFSELPMATHRKWIDVKELHPETIEFIKEKMVKIPDIDRSVQDLLLEIGEVYGIEPVLDVFMRRIHKDEEKKEKEGRRITDERYEVIPYHFNPGLSKFIVEHPEYIKIAGDWVSKMTADWSIYNWHVSHLFQRLEKGFSEIITSLIEKGGGDNLLKAARAMHSIDGTNFELCIEIIRKTDDKKILSQIDSNMYTTGGVSGEYGLAEAYENKAKMLEKYKTDENDRVKKFADRMSKSFLDSAKRERQRADEEKQLRKIEFEG